MNTNEISLRELRESRGWSLRKTSVLVGPSVGELNRVERGERKLSGASPARVVDAFDLDASAVAMISELNPNQEGIGA